MKVVLLPIPYPSALTTYNYLPTASRNRMLTRAAGASSVSPSPCGWLGVKLSRIRTGIPDFPSRIPGLRLHSDTIPFQQCTSMTRSPTTLCQNSCRLGKSGSARNAGENISEHIATIHTPLPRLRDLCGPGARRACVACAYEDHRVGETC